jgi:hypothetical protein
LAARLMRSSVATDVPPNFITRTGITPPALHFARGLREPPGKGKSAQQGPGPVWLSGARRPQ